MRRPQGEWTAPRLGLPASLPRRRRAATSSPVAAFRPALGRHRATSPSIPPSIDPFSPKKPADVAPHRPHDPRLRRPSSATGPTDSRSAVGTTATDRLAASDRHAGHPPDRAAAASRMRRLSCRSRAGTAEDGGCDGWVCRRVDPAAGCAPRARGPDCHGGRRRPRSDRGPFAVHRAMARAPPLGAHQGAPGMPADGRSR